MPTQWQDQYTDLSNVNSGNELQNGDDVLAQHINVALENGAYAKKKADTNAGAISTLQGNVSTIQGNVSTIQGNITSIQNDISSLSGRVTTLESRQNIVRHTGSVTYNASNFSLYNLIFSNPFIKFRYARSSSISRDEYPVFVSISANYTATPTSYTTSAYYMSGGQLNSVPSGATLQYEYFTES